MLLCQSAGEAVARLAQLRLPGPVPGMALLIGLLQWRRVQAPVETADALLAHLSLLFMPVGVMTHLSLLSQYGGRSMLATTVSTCIGLAVTAWVLRAARLAAARRRGAGKSSVRGAAVTTVPIAITPERADFVQRWV